MLTGIRYARYNPSLRATLIRTIAFFVFGSAYWALLPLVARTQIAGSATLYGVLLGVIGASAVGGAFLLRRLGEKLGADSLVAVASLGTALATALFAFARHPVTAMVASLIAGASWIAAVTVEYRIDPKNRIAFLHTLGQNSRERRRDGAYDWGIFEDPADDGRFIETFLTDSWLEHLRLHQRVTKADRISEQAVRRFQIGDGPKITHLISAQRN